MLLAARWQAGLRMQHYELIGSVRAVRQRRPSICCFLVLFAWLCPLSCPP